MDKDFQASLIGELVVESLEGLDAFDADLLALESAASNPQEPLRNAFRRIHTIKGSSACVGISPVERLAHVAENLLSRMRDGKMTVTPVLISSLLQTADRLRNMMHDLDRTGQCEGHDNRDLIELLHAMTDDGVPAAPATFGFFNLPEPGEPAEQVETPAVEMAAVEPSTFEASAGASAETPVAESSAVATPAPAPVSAPAPEARTQREEAAPPDDGGASRGSASENAIRLDVRHIDRLMNLVGELVLARNHIMQFASRLDPVLQGSVQRVNHITTELQQSVMKTRMQPVGNIWAKFPRVVRDVSQEVGKQVRLVMEGSDTELDRAVVEAIKDPLMHILRNAVDHGIERPEDRLAAGKPAEGRLCLRAFHEGGQVIIEVADDGRGIATAKVTAKAVERGLITAAQAAKLTEDEVFALIFLPGFSTAERVTSISGRGVGMDVVRSNIEKIGGAVDLRSTAGAGTTLRIKIPLTLAIIPALVIDCAGERFAIPQAALVELVWMDSQQRKIEYAAGRPVFRLRGSLLPLVYLDETLRMKRQAAAGEYVVVLRADGRQFGLVVDAIRDTEEIVVKPLAKELKDIGVYAGATIMGDGRVALILDVFSIARETGVLNSDAAAEHVRAETAAAVSQTESLLVIRAGGNRMAIPLRMVMRLEEVKADRIERASRGPVIQYRDSIMRVIDLSRSFNLMPAPAGDVVSLVVCAGKGEQVGLIVEQVEDIVEEAVSVRTSATQPGISGSGVVRGRVTDFIDVPAVAAMHGIRGLEA